MTRILKKTLKNFLRFFGYDIHKIQDTGVVSQHDLNEYWDTFDCTKIQYACGPKYLENWVNIDFYTIETMKSRYDMPENVVYYQADLSLRQPFRDESFSFAYAEDFIEHISQADSLIFLNECYRILNKSGVLRLSFPGLEGVLRRHFNTKDYTLLLQGKKDAFDKYLHIHFYSREELSHVAHHIGFSKVQFVTFGESDHDTLKNLETREKQQDLNIYVELTK